MTEEKKPLELTGIEAIRLLSGIIVRDDATNRLAIVNLLARHLLGLAELAVET